MAYNNQNTQNTEVMELDKLQATIASQATKWIADDIQAGKIPEIPGYNTGSEMIGAMMKVAQTKDRNGRPALQVCTRESILSSLRDMAIQGLSMSRNQCYPIVYGSQLTIQPSYFGTICAFNRMFPDYKVTADVLYEGDEYVLLHDDLFDFDYIELRARKLENRDNPIVAAYGSVVDMARHERVYGCVMTSKEIKTSWSHAKTDKVQKEFPQEMAKRTLINRMLKMFVNTSSSIVNPEMASAYTRMVQGEYEEAEAQQTSEVSPETRKMIRQKSKGEAGLVAMLKPSKDSAEVAETKAEEAEPDKAPAPADEPEETVDEHGEIVDEQQYVQTDMFGNDMEIPF